MGQIDYTRRRTERQNLGQVRRVEMPEVSAFARANERLGDSIANLGSQMLGFATRQKREEEDRLLAEDAIEIRKMWRQRMSNSQNGYILREQGGAKGLSEEAGTAFEEDFNNVTSERSSKHIERLKIMLGGHLSDMMGVLSVHEAKELKKAGIVAADALVGEDANDWASGIQTEDAFKMAKANLLHACELKGLDENLKAAEVRKWSQARFCDLVQTRLYDCASKEDFDTLVEELTDGPEKLAELYPSLKAELAKDANGNGIAKDLQQALVEKVTNEGLRFESRQEHIKRQAAGEVRAMAVNEELKSMDADLSDREWVEFYRKLGENGELRELAPETALRYLEQSKRLEEAVKAKDEHEKVKAEQAEAQKLREIAQRHKAEVDATEEQLSLRLTNLAMHELNGDRELMGGQLAAEQAAIWRDYKVALHGGMLGEGFANTFLNRLKNRLTDQERTAMREFYGAFGYHGDLEKDGDLTETSRRANLTTRFTQPTELEPSYSGSTITGKQLFELGETFLGQLRTMGPDAYRSEIMRTMIDEIKTRKLADDFNKNRDELAKDMMTLMINAGTDRKLETEKTEKKEEKDGE